MDLDSYYTPRATADLLVEVAGLPSVRTCFDSNCGDGSLLEAAARRHRSALCMGLDKNNAAVRRLRKKHPRWLLSIADALLPTTWSRVEAARKSKACDLVTMNPPFSMGYHKGIWIAVGDDEFRCSVAMAHVATTLTQIGPQRCCAIVPESLMTSELDAEVRAVVMSRYKVTIATELKNSTFRGARANALVLNLDRRSRPRPLSITHAPAALSDILVRGGLPVHEARRSRTGLPFLHSTAITTILGQGIASLPRVVPIDRGIVSGHVILVPRVGTPLRPITATYLSQRVQLSDCVIALRFDSKRSAQLAKKQIEAHWPQFERQWRGTGARYITVKTLSAWCASNHIL